MLDNPLRPEQAYEVHRRLAEEEAKRFLEHGAVKYGSVVTNCLICSSKQLRRVDPGFLRCVSCESLLASPRIEQSAIDELLTDSGSSAWFQREIYAKTIEARRMTMLPRLELIKARLNAGRIFEAGCGQGIFLDLLKDAGYQCHGCDPLRFNYQAASRHRVALGTLEDDKSSDFDAVVAWEVIAHSLQPVAFVERAFSMLKPGGFFFLSTPNSTAIEYDSIWADGALHHDNLKPHVFLQIFSPTGLRKILEHAGFEVEELRTPGSMDVLNIRQLKEREGLKFVCYFFEIVTQLENSFQKFLCDNLLSGHMLCVAKKPLE